MRATLTPTEAHRQYDQAVAAFAKLIPAPALRSAFPRQMDAYLRQCALGVWNADNPSQITPRHVEFYNAIYSAPNPSPAALYWEVATGVAGYEGFQPPVFFQQLLQQEGELALRFIDQLTLLLLLFAAVDDLVSEPEAGFVNACADALVQRCQKDGLAPQRAPLKADEFITKKAESPTKATEEKTPPPDLDEVLAELNALCGLERVKQDVESLINLVKVRRLRQEHELPVPPMSLHLVFMGNPGTGKTTVARLLAKIYHAIGVLSQGQLIEVDRAGLVAGFVGQTALKTQEVVQSAVGGVLFIDEAYALVNQENGNDFGHEAIEVLLKNMEDHRQNLIVIVAGYTHLMEKFIHSNPGLASRFNKYMFFEDYTPPQLFEIFSSLCRKNGYTLADPAKEWAQRAFQALYDQRDENFGNAREVRNLFETALTRHSDRLAALEAPTREQLMELLAEDLHGEADPDNRLAQNSQ